MNVFFISHKTTDTKKNVRVIEIDRDLFRENHFKTHFSFSSWYWYFKCCFTYSFYRFYKETATGLLSQQLTVSFKSQNQYTRLLKSSYKGVSISNVYYKSIKTVRDIWMVDSNKLVNNQPTTHNLPHKLELSSNQSHPYS